MYARGYIQYISNVIVKIRRTTIDRWGSQFVLPESEFKALSDELDPLHLLHRGQEGLEHLPLAVSGETKEKENKMSE